MLSFQFIYIYWGKTGMGLERLVTLQTLSHTVESRTPPLSRIQTHTIVVIDTDCIGICETNLLPYDHDHDSPYRACLVDICLSG
jgi:hypothetical protein